MFNALFNVGFNVVLTWLLTRLLTWPVKWRAATMAAHAAHRLPRRRSWQGRSLKWRAAIMAAHAAHGLPRRRMWQGRSSGQGGSQFNVFNAHLTWQLVPSPHIKSSVDCPHCNFNFFSALDAHSCDCALFFMWATAPPPPSPMTVSKFALPRRRSWQVRAVPGVHGGCLTRI